MLHIIRMSKGQFNVSIYFFHIFDMKIISLSSMRCKWKQKLLRHANNVMVKSLKIRKNYKIKQMKWFGSDQDRNLDILIY